MQRIIAIVIMLLGAGMAYYFTFAAGERFESADGEAVVWPPQLEQVYPDIAVIDHLGREFGLHDLQGKVTLIEPVGMNCAACNAFAGGAKKGGLEGNAVQGGVSSIEKIFQHYTKSPLANNADVNFVILLLYDLHFGDTEPNDAKAWAAHFGYDKMDNVFVVVPKQDVRGKGSFNMIPGFQLLDKQMRLRWDSTGHHPQHNLYKQLLPAIAYLVHE